MSEANVTEIKTLNGYPLADAKAREDIAKLSMEKVDRNGTGQITKENTTFWKHVESDNLFNADAITAGAYINNLTGQITPHSGNTVGYTYVKLRGSGVYQLRVNTTFYGKLSALRVPLYDENKSYIKSLVGTATDASHPEISTVYPISVEITQSDIESGCEYLGYTCNITDANTLMVVKGDKYPDKYIPYGDRWEIPELIIPDAGNVLAGKTIIMNGDSICEDAYGQKTGWVGRIGNRNDMSWSNYGFGGGTIAEGVVDGSGNTKHSVCGTIDAMYAAHPSADYVIIEGGTNDADLIGDALTTQPEKFGSFDFSDYGGTYDTSTFCGAMETICYKLSKYWKHAKVGYIVAQKMGYTNNGYTAETNNRRKYFDTAVAICKKWGIPVLDLWDGTPLNPRLAAYYDGTLNKDENEAAGNYYLDGQHLTSHGYDWTSTVVEAWIRTL